MPYEASFGVFLATIAATTAYLLHVERCAGFTIGDIVRVHGTMAAAILIGVIGYAMVEQGPPFRFPGVYGIRQVRYPGLLLAGLAILPVLARLLPGNLSVAAFGDLVIPGLTFSLVGLRLSCLLAGCCFGRVTSLPWALTFPADSLAAGLHVAEGQLTFGSSRSLPVHPLQVYFGVWALVVGAFLVWYRDRKAYDGQLVLLFLALHESGKGLLEFVRPPSLGNRHLAGVSLAFAVVGVVGLALKRTSLRSNA